jgi:hypothetical protein
MKSCPPSIAKLVTSLWLISAGTGLADDLRKELHNTTEALKSLLSPPFNFQSYGGRSVYNFELMKIDDEGMQYNAGWSPGERTFTVRFADLLPDSIRATKEHDYKVHFATPRRKPLITEEGGPLRGIKMSSYDDIFFPNNDQAQQVAAQLKTAVDLAERLRGPVSGVAGPGGITVTGAYKHDSPAGMWSRGMSATMYCGNSPESWVRGNAWFDATTGVLTMTIQLETDSTAEGPKGKVTAFLKDAAGKTVATASSEEVGTGGKPPGKSAIRNFTSHANIDPDVASEVTAIYLDAQCTGSVTRLFNVSEDTLKDAFKIGVQIAEALNGGGN